jgi:sulfur carrier protein ThiS
MQIQVRAYGTPRLALEKKRLIVTVDDGATIGDVLSNLTDDYGIDANELVVMKDGTHVRQLDREATQLTDGDQLVLADTIDE